MNSLIFRNTHVFFRYFESFVLKNVKFQSFGYVISQLRSFSEHWTNSFVNIALTNFRKQEFQNNEKILFFKNSCVFGKINNFISYIRAKNVSWTLKCTAETSIRGTLKFYVLKATRKLAHWLLARRIVGLESRLI